MINSFLPSFSPLLQQRNTYDRRTSTDRVARAVRQMGEETLAVIGDEEEESTSGERAEGKEDEEREEGGPPQRQRQKRYAHCEGDVVAVCDTSSSPSHPEVLIAKIVHLERRRGEALLALLRRDEEQDNRRGTAYRFVVGKDSWWEDLDAAIHPLDVAYEEERRLYRLRTPLSEIRQFFAAGKNTN